MFQYLYIVHHKYSVNFYNKQFFQPLMKIHESVFEIKYPLFLKHSPELYNNKSEIY